jgi:hypothetical protein
VPVSLLASLLCCGAAGLTILAREGFPQRTAALNEQATALYWRELGLHERDDCAAQFAVPGRCLSDGKTPRVAVLGDSHSSNVFFALSHAYAKSNTGVVRLGRGGCPPLYGVKVSDSGKRDICLHTTRAHLDWVLARDSITTVFLSSMGPMYIHPGRKRFQLAYPGQAERHNKAGIFAAALDDTVQRLLAGGKEVVLVIDWPGLGFHPQTCVDIRPLRLTAFQVRECRIPRQRYERIAGHYRSILQDIATRHRGVKLWDTAQALCDDSHCYGMRDGVLLYRDPGHLSLPGSRYLGDRLKLLLPGDS